VIVLYHYDLPWRLKIDKVFEFIMSRNWGFNNYPDSIKDKWSWFRDDDSKPFPWDYEPMKIGEKEAV